MQWDASGFFERLERLRKARDESKREVALAVGVKAPAYTHWQKGPPSIETALLLAEHFSVHPAFLLFGQKTTMRTNVQQLQVRLIEDRRAPVNRRAELPVYKVGKGKGAVAIPRWESVAAGFGEDLERSEEVTHIRELPDWRGVHSIIVRGDSMLETLRPKDLILVQVLGGETGIILPPAEDGSSNSRKQLERFVKDDELFIVSVNNEPPTVKRVQYEGNGPWFVRLMPDNPAYKPRTILKTDHVVFWAKVLGIGDGKYA